PDAGGRGPADPGRDPPRLLRIPHFQRNHEAPAGVAVRGGRELVRNFAELYHRPDGRTRGSAQVRQVPSHYGRAAEEGPRMVRSHRALGVVLRLLHRWRPAFYGDCRGHFQAEIPHFCWLCMVRWAALGIDVSYPWILSRREMAADQRDHTSLFDLHLAGLNSGGNFFLTY